jgi:hypothetical protein
VRRRIVSMPPFRRGRRQEHDLAQVCRLRHRRLPRTRSDGPGEGLRPAGGACDAARAAACERCGSRSDDTPRRRARGSGAPSCTCRALTRAPCGDRQRATRPRFEPHRGPAGGSCGRDESAAAQRAGADGESGGAMPDIAGRRRDEATDTPAMPRHPRRPEEENSPEAERREAGDERAACDEDRCAEREQTARDDRYRMPPAARRRLTFRLAGRQGSTWRTGKDPGLGLAPCRQQFRASRHALHALWRYPPAVRLKPAPARRYVAR